MSELRNINYQSKDFGALRNQLIEFAKNYFPESYSDFTVASPGMMFIEMAAYVGDILSFYQDIQLQETFLEFAKNPKNLYNIAYMMGYRPKVTHVAEAELTVQQIVDAVREGNDYQPNWVQACKLPEYTQVHSSAADNSTFLFQEALDFSYSSSNSPTLVEIAEFQEGTQIPSKFVLTKTVRAFSGEIKSYCHYFGDYEKFPTIELPDDNIVGIIKAYNTDIPTEEWTEVPTLGQDTVFAEEKNEMANEDGTAYNLVVKKVPNRFVTRFLDNKKLQIQFGAGIHPQDFVADFDEQSILPNPINLAASPDEFIVDGYDKAYDPSNFMFSRSYGVVPVHMKMTFEYIVGGGLAANIPANTLTAFEKLREGQYTYPNATGKDKLGEPKVYVTNRAAASGGTSGDTIEEVRQNALKAFAEQKRVVTLKDFAVRSLSMPQKFGTISKVLAVKDQAAESILDTNPLAVTLYVLGQNMDGKLQRASTTVKKNLKTYLSEYMMITDAIDIKDAYVINFKVQYEIVLRPGFSADSVLLACDKKIEEYFKLDRRTINQPILISEINSILDQVQGVQTVKSIEFSNLYDVTGKRYSEYSYDIGAATRERVIYPSFDPCIFELRYPETDIVGRVTNY